MSVLYPLILLALLSLAYAPYLFRVRVNAVRRGDVDIEHFKLFKEVKTGIPEQVIKAKHHYTTLYEMPVLFYTAALTVLVLGLDGAAYALLGYAYVAARLAHSYVHLTHNTLKWRVRAFGASYLVLVAMWLLIVWDSAFMGPVRIGVTPL